MRTAPQCCALLVWLLAPRPLTAENRTATPEASTSVPYPGPRPGRADVRLTPTLLTMSNAALAMTWSVGPQGLRPIEVRDLGHGDRLIFTGELFEFTAGDGTRYPASGLTADPPPRLRTTTAHPHAARLAARRRAQQIELGFHSADGRFRARWRALIPDDANYVRQELDLAAVRKPETVAQITWAQESWPGARTAGRVAGSPVVVDDFFLGVEDPNAENRAEDETQCRWASEADLRPGQTLRTSFVLGVAPPGQRRRGFLHYLELERAHPYRPFPHYNSWYDLSWEPFALNEANCLATVRLLGERFIQPYGVKLDAVVFDDGWDDPRTLWQFHQGFPRGFTAVAALARRYGTHLGVWLSPFGGYGEPRSQRLKFGQAAGYEINRAGFSLAGPRYYAAFKRACATMIDRYGVNYFKFDGIAAGMYANGAGAEYLRDTEAMRRLMGELRQADPDLFLNLTTGSWPSPFWLRYADSVWRQGDDMGLAGKGSRQQQWLTYRDQETFRNIVGKGPLYPLNALMTQGVAYSRHGPAGDPSFTSDGFRDDVWAFFGSGTCLQELYLQPDRLAPRDWAVLAEAARWSRARAAILADTHWIGGDPGNLEPYGFAAWRSGQGTLMLRNPDEQPHEFPLEVGAAFELPVGAARRFRLQSPMGEGSPAPPSHVEAGTPLRILLSPFQVVVLDAAAEG